MVSADGRAKEDRGGAARPDGARPAVPLAFDLNGRRMKEWGHSEFLDV